MADRDAVLREIVDGAGDYMGCDVYSRAEVESAVREAWDAALEHAMAECDTYASFPTVDSIKVPHANAIRKRIAALRQPPAKGGKG